MRPAALGRAGPRGRDEKGLWREWWSDLTYQETWGGPVDNVEVGRERWGWQSGACRELPQRTVSSSEITAHEPLSPEGSPEKIPDHGRGSKCTLTGATGT